MATLKDAIKAKLGVVVSSAMQVRLTNQDDTEATTPTDAVLDAAAESAAATVEEYLGSGITDSDKFAVGQGVRLAISELSGVYTGLFPPETMANEDRVREMLADAAERRALEDADPVLTEIDHADLDKRFPGSTWVESEGE